MQNISNSSFIGIFTLLTWHYNNMRHKSIFVDVVCDTYFNRLGKTFLFEENILYLIEEYTKQFSFMKKVGRKSWIFIMEERMMWWCSCYLEKILILRSKFCLIHYLLKYDRLIKECRCNVFPFFTSMVKTFC